MDTSNKTWKKGNRPKPMSWCPATLTILSPVRFNTNLRQGQKPAGAVSHMLSHAATCFPTPTTLGRRAKMMESPKMDSAEPTAKYKGGSLAKRSTSAKKGEATSGRTDVTYR